MLKMSKLEVLLKQHIEEGELLIKELDLLLEKSNNK